MSVEGYIIKGAVYVDEGCTLNLCVVYSTSQTDPKPGESDFTIPLLVVADMYQERAAVSKSYTNWE